MNRKIVAIHQPNFFPWMGYFNKIARSDIFILLDNVQFPKSDGTWSNRVKLLIGGKPSWVTMPIVRSYQGTRLYTEMEINNTTPWREKLLKTIQMNYSRAPFFNETFSWLKKVIMQPGKMLADYNISAIKEFMCCLQLDTSKLVLGSSLAAAGKATDLLINQVKQVGGTTYLCGGGAEGYQEDELFQSCGLELIYQNFKHPVYPQVKSEGFSPGLSTIDCLLNCGFEGTREILC